MLKLDVGEEVLMSCTDFSSMEGLMDKIAYFFTSDKSISEKIGNMLFQLGKMDEDDRKKIDALHIDYKMQSYDNTRKILSFSGEAVDFVVSHTAKFESKSYVVMENERDAIRDEINSMVTSFNASHDREAILKLMKTGPDVADRTYSALGFHFNNLYAVANEFKTSQSGRLSRMKKMKFIANVVARKPEHGTIAVIHSASIGLANIIDEAMECYKYVDKFLFYTYRILEKQGLIH